MRSRVQRSGGRRQTVRRAVVVALALAAAAGAATGGSHAVAAAVDHATNGRGAAAALALAGERPARDTLISTGARQSHDGLYGAAVTVTSDGIALRRPSDWVVAVMGRDGAPVEGAAVRAALWHVDEQTSPSRINVTDDGAGRYRLAGVHLDRGGWWNVKLSITARSGTDSLAFNVIIDDER